MACVIEKLVTINFKIILSLHKHWRNHSPNRGVKELLRQVDYVFRYPLTYEELRALVGEVVAVVLQYIVCLLSEARAHIFEELHEELFRQLSESEINSLSWSAFQTWLTDILPKGVLPGSS